MYRFKGYSVLEIVLVTSFIIIFVVVTNPATYINRFSKMLLKMSVLNESSVMINKLNSFSFMECSKLSISSSEFMFSQNDTYSLRFQSNTLMLKNISNGTEAVLYRYINLDSTNEIRYFDYFFNQTSQIDDVQYIDLRLGSSLLDHSVLTGIMCDNQQIKIGEF